MTLKRNLLIYFLALLIFPLQQTFSQSKTVVSGIAHGAMGKKIRLLTYDDQISCLTKELSSTIADTSGKFELIFNISSTCFANLYIDEYAADLYIKPGDDLKIEINAEKYDEGTAEHFTPKSLTVNFPYAKNDDINLLIFDFNSIYSDFVEKKFKNIYYNHDKIAVDSFFAQIAKRYEIIKDEFFLDLEKYRLASLELLSHKINKQLVFQKYFNPCNIKYNNPGYMEFFVSFFDAYATQSLGQIKTTSLKNAVNVQKNYLALFNALGEDSLLQNEILRELVMLITLKNMYYSPDYDKKAIIGILNEINKNSKVEQHKIIAANLVKLFSLHQKGSKAPYFNLRNQYEKFISLDDFKGKYIYLTFWNTKCIDCEAEFDLISKVYDKYKNKIEILSICTDKNFMTMQFYLKNKKYNWNFLHFNGNYELLDDYQIKTVPFYILIDDKGNIAEYPAKNPIYNIEKYFDKIIENEK